MYRNLLILFLVLASWQTAHAQQPDTYVRTPLALDVSGGTVRYIFTCRSKVMWIVTNLGTMVRYDGMSERVYEIDALSTSGLELIDSADRELLIQRGGDRNVLIGHILNGQLTLYDRPVESALAMKPQAGHLYELGELTPETLAGYLTERPQWTRKFSPEIFIPLDSSRYLLLHKLHVGIDVTYLDLASGLSSSPIRTIGFQQIQVHDGHAYLLDITNTLHGFGPKGILPPIDLTKGSRTAGLLNGGYVQIGKGIHRIDPQQDELVLTPVLDGSEESEMIWIHAIVEENTYMSFGRNLGLVKWQRNSFGHVEPIKEEQWRVPYSVCVYGNGYLTSKGLFWGPGEASLQLFTASYSGFSLFRSSQDRVFTDQRDGILEVHKDSIELIHPCDLRGHRALFAENTEGVWLGYGRNIVKLEGAKSYEIKAEAQESITGMGPLHSDQIWIGCADSLYLFDPKEDQDPRPYLYTHSPVRDLLELGADTLLLATYGHGLKVVINGKLKSLLLHQPRELTYSHRLILDPEGYIWVSTNNGLFSFSKQAILQAVRAALPSVSFQYFGEAEGLTPTEFNGGVSSSGILGANGQIVLPTMSGLTYFNPADLALDRPHPNPSLALVAGDETQYYQLSDDVVIELGQDLEDLRMLFSCTNYGHRLNAFAYYRVKDGTWKSLPVDQYIDLSALLHHGSHHLELYVPWIGHEMRMVHLTLEVIPYWYQRWAGQLGLLILGGMVILLLIQWRTRQLTEQNRQLQETVVDQKGTISKQRSSLRNYVERLEASQEQLVQEVVLRERLLGQISHDVMGNLRHIKELSSSLAQSGDLNSSKEQLPVIASATRKVYRLMENSMQWAKLKRNMVRKNLTPLRLHSMAERIRDDLSTYPKAELFPILNHIPEEAILLSDEQILHSILSNLLENQLKHSASPCTIRLEISNDPHGTRLRIINEANPLPNVAQLNELLAADSGSGAIKVDLNKGMGFILIKELLDTLSAEMHITSSDRDHQYSLYFPDANEK